MAISRYVVGDGLMSGYDMHDTHSASFRHYRTIRAVVETVPVDRIRA